MIEIDTHIWVWWVNDVTQLTPKQREILTEYESKGIGVSVISCWEVAKLVQIGRLELPEEVETWLEMALAYPGIELLDFTPRVAVESTTLPGEFHKDPADQIIVATARVHDIPLMTADTRIRAYPYIKLIA